MLTEMFTAFNFIVGKKGLIIAKSSRGKKKKRG